MGDLIRFPVERRQQEAPGLEPIGPQCEAVLLVAAENVQVQGTLFGTPLVVADGKGVAVRLRPPST